MNRTTMDLWVGIFVALGIAALFGLAMKVANLTSSNLGETYTVSAAFDNIGGLKAKAPVKSAGVVIGRVDAIKYDNELHEAVVSLKLDKRYKFSQDTDASILTAGLLGEQYVGIETGGLEEPLKQGDKITHTEDAMVLEKLISKFLFSKAAENTPAAPAENTGASSNSLNNALDASPLDKIK